MSTHNVNICRRKSACSSNNVYGENENGMSGAAYISVKRAHMVSGRSAMALGNEAASRRRSLTYGDQA